MSPTDLHPATDVEAARAIFRRYYDHYDGEVQGCCPVIADEISATIGGEIVAGELTWHSGSCRRTHWWVEKDGVVLDPMGDWLLEPEMATGREEHHRDRYVFDAILPRYERWRVTPAPAAEPPDEAPAPGPGMR